jgi:uncharacterized membrane protein YbhN (UPF0104 family)
MHKVDAGDGQRITIAAAVREHLRELDPSHFWPLIIIAASVKAVGVFASMVRWQLLLIGQGIRFNFGHTAGTFLIGRFLGTFLPSTIGLDGYKLYDAAKYSGRTVPVAAATAVEKVMGLAGIFLTFLLTLPFGYQVLGEHAGLAALVTVPIAAAVVAVAFALLFRPTWAPRLAKLAFFGNVKIGAFIERLTTSAMAYKGKGGLLAAVAVLSFVVHFTTAALYYFTALAIGAEGATFGAVSFASSIQIVATVLTPFTIAGEGVREIVQALLLAKQIGATQSVLSAALGFWAAEALTLCGAFFWWARRGDYRPKVAELRHSSSPDPR